MGHLMKQFLNLDIWPMSHSLMVKKTQRTVKEDMKDKEWKKSYGGNKLVAVSSVSPIWLFSPPWTVQPTPHPPGSSIHEISQARILEWVVVSFSRRSSYWEKSAPQIHICSIAGEFFTTELPGKPQ